MSQQQAKGPLAATVHIRQTGAVVRILADSPHIHLSKPDGLRRELQELLCAIAEHAEQAPSQ